MNALRFPKAAQYIESLPDGLDSYPHCVVKGSVLRQLTDSSPVAFPNEGLSPVIRALVDSPPLPSDWIPEVQFNALMLAHEDLIEPDTFQKWVYDRNRHLFSSSLYRVLFLVMSPERLITGMTHRWRAFRKGTELQTVEQSKNFIVVELRHPPHLYELHALTNLTIAVRAAMDAAGGKNTAVKLVLQRPDCARISIRWD